MEWQALGRLEQNDLAHLPVLSLSNLTLCLIVPYMYRVYDLLNAWVEDPLKAISSKASSLSLSDQISVTSHSHTHVRSSRHQAFAG